MRANTQCQFAVLITCPFLLISCSETHESSSNNNDFAAIERAEPTDEQLVLEKIVNDVRTNQQNMIMEHFGLNEKTASIALINLNFRGTRCSWPQGIWGKTVFDSTEDLNKSKEPYAEPILAIRLDRLDLKANPDGFDGNCRIVVMIISNGSMKSGGLACYYGAKKKNGIWEVVCNSVQS